MEEQKKRIALILQYDGTSFSGFQIQNNDRSIQGELEKALFVLYRKKIRITAAGRTDAGVHALGQVAHFDAYSSFPLNKLCNSLNGILASDVSVKNAYFVPSDFNARYSAVQREYIYLIYNHPQRNPLLKNKALWVKPHLDIDIFKKIAKNFIGEKDFASFCKTDSCDENTIRRINEFEITRKDEIIMFRIKGTAFLRNMIRIITGTMLDFLKDGTPPDKILEIIEKKDRRFAGITAPAHGLYLNQITYNPPLNSFKSAF